MFSHSSYEKVTIHGLDLEICVMQNLQQLELNTLGNALLIKALYEVKLLTLDQLAVENYLIQWFSVTSVFY